MSSPSDWMLLFELPVLNKVNLKEVPPASDNCPFLFTSGTRQCWGDCPNEGTFMISKEGVLWVRISLTSCLCFINFAEQQTCWLGGLWSEICVWDRQGVLQEGCDHQGLCLAYVSFVLGFLRWLQWWWQWWHILSLREGLGSQCSSLFLST